MVPSGSSNPMSGAQSVSPALLQSNSAILGSQGSPLHPHATFSSLVSPQSQYNINLIGNTGNVSSLLNQGFGNGGANSGLSGLGGFQRGSFDTNPDSDPFSIVANDVPFSASPSSFASASRASSVSSAQVQNQQQSNSSGNPVLTQRTSQVQQFEMQKFQLAQQSVQQYPASHSQSQQHQPQFQSIQGGCGVGGPVKLEPQIMNDPIGPQQQLPPLRNLGAMKLEQQNQIGRGMAAVKLERQHSDQAIFLQQQQHQLQQQQQQQQQQQFLQLSKQSSPAALAQMNLLQQQQILQLQQQQQQHQQQLMKAYPQQRPQLRQQFQQQSMPVRSVGRLYEPGTCARRLTQLMHQQQCRPNDNNIEFWRKFVAEFFAPKAKKRWCVSLYGNSRQTNGVFPQDMWHCEICNRKPGRGFETTAEVFPRLFKIKYDSGTLEELLYVDMPHEYQNANGQIVLDYAKAIQESVFEHLRVVRDGQLRIVFSPDLKICSWEFCARHHEELIPRRLIIPQVSQLGAAAQKYQASAQNASSNLSTPDLQNNCNMFVVSARQLAKALEVPLVNDLGYTKRYVRCLQISEVVNSLKDLIDYSRETGMGPMESLAKFTRRSSPLPGLLSSSQHPEQQQQVTLEDAKNDHHPMQATSVQPNKSNSAANISNSQCATSTSTSATNIVGLHRQNSMNSRIENQINNPSSPYSGTPVQIPSAGSSTTLPQAHPNPSSPFSSPTPSSSNNPPQSSHNTLAASASANHMNSANSPAQVQLQQSSQSNEDDHESPSSVEKIIQEIMISSQLSEAGSLVSASSVGNNVKNINGLAQLGQNSLTRGNCLGGNGPMNNNLGAGSGGLGNLGGGIGLSASGSGIRGGLGNHPSNLTGRMGMPMLPQDAGMNHQQQELSNRLYNGLGAANSFNNFQFDWKSP